MLVSLLVAVVSGFDDWVKEVGEDFVGFFIASDGADGHDEGMAGVVDAGLFDGYSTNFRRKNSPCNMYHVEDILNLKKHKGSQIIEIVLYFRKNIFWDEINRLNKINKDNPIP